MVVNVNEDEVQVSETSQSLGERLRLARESKKFSVAEVAAQLRFTKDTILHMESQQWDKLHGRAYARGYFSSYIKFLDLPQNEFLAAFNLEYKSSESDLATPNLNSAKSKSFPWMPVIFVVIAIVIMGFAYLQWQQSQQVEQEEVIETLPWQQSEETQTEVDAFEESVVEPLTIDETAEQIDDELEMLSNVLGSDNNQELDSNTDEVEPQSEPIEPNESQDTGETLDIEVTPDDASNNVQAEEVVVSESQLELYSLQDCWVEVSDAKSNVLLYKTIKANESVSLVGLAPLTVTLGSAANVTVKFNDALFDTTPYTLGGVAKFTLGTKS